MQPNDYNESLINAKGKIVIACMIIEIRDIKANNVPKKLTLFLTELNQWKQMNKEYLYIYIYIWTSLYTFGHPHTHMHKYTYIYITIKMEKNRKFRTN